MRKINKIIIHCSATPEGRHVTVEDIDKWHRDRGFNGIGYHYVVYIDGSVHQGREEAIQGAHCAGHNSKSIGICYIGGCVNVNGKLVSKDTRTAAQKEALSNLVQDLIEKYPNATVHGHNEFSQKDCPCFDVREEYEYVV